MHNVWQRHTVEFRYFEATLHAGKIKSYIQLALGLANYAANASAVSSRKLPFNQLSARYDFRAVLMRMVFKGKEFESARLHLLARLGGDSAFKNTQRPTA
jgi:hypothetical protein